MLDPKESLDVYEAIKDLFLPRPGKYNEINLYLNFCIICIYYDHKVPVLPYQKIRLRMTLLSLAYAYNQAYCLRHNEKDHDGYSFALEHLGLSEALYGYYVHEQVNESKLEIGMSNDDIIKLFCEQEKEYISEYINSKFPNIEVSLDDIINFFMDFGPKEESEGDHKIWEAFEHQLHIVQLAFLESYMDIY